MYLKMKDCAKILYNLYEEIFNRYDLVRVPIELKEQQIKKFAVCNLSKEEIWAYAHRLVFLPINEPYLARLDELREGQISKQSFVLMVAIPAYRIFVNSDAVAYAEKVNKFAFEADFFAGIFSTEEERRNWLWFEGESIRSKDAEKIVENIKNFFASRNC